MSEHPPAIRFLSSASSDQTSVDSLVELVNRVYEAAEVGLWITGTARTGPREMADLVASGQIAVAGIGEALVGCVRIRRLDPSTGEFGMLAAEQRFRGRGLGRELVRFAEWHSRELGCDTMQLELLTPRRASHPTKRVLHDWYTRMGYRIVRRDALDAEYPHLAPKLAEPCDLVVYHRPLG